MGNKPKLLLAVGFLSAALAVFCTCGAEAGAVADCRAVGSPAYRPLRRELRAFYPDECHGRCKSPDFDRSADAITNEVTQWAAAHPGFDALDLRRESYRAMRRHFRPFLFHESPFYFESGVNGGWCFKHVPARVVNRLCEPIRQSLVPPSAFERMYARANARLAFCCGPFVDDMHHVPAFRVLREKGFKGVWEETKAALASCPADDPLGRKELETALEGLETIHDLQLKFADEAERRLKASDVPARERRWLERIAESARRCPWEPPRTFFEGLNFLWFVREIPSYVDGLSSYSLGRPDAWFIDLYRQDLAAGRLTVEEAKDLIARWLVTSDCHYDGMITVDGGDDHEAEMPMTLGGCDAEGRPVWNELTEMVVDQHVETDCVFPKLNVRFDAHSPKAYLEKIAQYLIDGHAAFALFNDAAAIPGFVAHGIPLADARDYVACGCWDGNVDTWTDVDAGNYMSAARVLELTLYPDPDLERRIGVTFDPIDGATSFEEVKRIYMRNLLKVYRTTVSDYTRYGRTASKAFPHPAYSACLKGCLERRRDTTDGGAAFRPRVMTLGFAASVADSLAAIEQVVFRDRRATLPEFLDAVRSNWKGPRGAELRAAALASPYWGDNRPESNALVRWLFTGVADGLEGFKNDNDGPYVISAWIYREFLYWGLKMRATPDGRFDGDRLTQGFTPSDYRCEGDVTTVINAIGSAPHDRLYASNANLTFEKSGMTPQILAAVFRVFGEKGGHLLQPNCNSVDELLDAQKHPERHLNLFVKVCGFSARFIALSKRWQDEVISRHRLK